MQRDTLQIIKQKPFTGYELLDLGHGRKLERFGDVIVNRPEPQAMTIPELSKEEWDKAVAIFDGIDDAESGKWQVAPDVPEGWNVNIGGKTTMLCRLASFRHMGLFPEQKPHWDFMAERLSGRTQPKVLNLFGYTGAASLIAAGAGAGEVVHVDASKKAISWGKENQELSKMKDAPIRWICEDARKFVAREVRREREYDCVLIDPPKFGRGANGEVWDLFTDLPDLLGDCAKITKGNGIVILTSYAIRASVITFHELMRQNYPDKKLDSGELALETLNGQLLGTSHFIRAT